MEEIPEGWKAALQEYVALSDAEKDTYLTKLNDSLLGKTKEQKENLIAFMEFIQETDATAELGLDARTQKIPTDNSCAGCPDAWECNTTFIKQGGCTRIG